MFVKKREGRYCRKDFIEVSLEKGFKRSHRGDKKGNGAFDPAKISELVLSKDELLLSRSSG